MHAYPVSVLLSFCIHVLTIFTRADLSFCVVFFFLHLLIFCAVFFCLFSSSNLSFCVVLFLLASTDFLFCVALPLFLHVLIFHSVSFYLPSSMC